MQHVRCLSCLFLRRQRTLHPMVGSEVDVNYATKEPRDALYPAECDYMRAFLLY